MAQVASNSDPQLSKGGGTKKQQKGEGKPARAEIDKRIKQLKELVSGSYNDEQIEKVLEVNNYDVNSSMNHIFDGNPIPQSFEGSDWKQVGRNSSTKEPKAKPSEKKPGEIANEKKDKNEYKPDYDKRNDRDDKPRGEGRPDRKPKKPFKQEGADGALEGHRGPRDRDSKQNGSPNTNNRPPRRPSGPVPASSKPPQQSQQHPPHTSPHPQPQSSWGPPAHQAAQSQPAAATTAPVSTTQNPPPSQPQSTSSPATQGRAPLSYSKIVQGKPTPPPQPQPPVHQTQPPNPAAASASASAAPPSTTPPQNAPYSKQDFQSPLGTRPHARPSPPNTAWRPKDPNAASPTLSATPSAPSPTPSSTTSAATAQNPATISPASVPLPSTPQPAHQAPQPQAAPQTTQPQAPQPQVQAQPQPQATQATTPPAPVHTQPAPISPPTSASSQPKRQSVLIDGSNLRLPPSLQYSENISYQFGSMGLDSKPKDLVLNFGTQPTNTPATTQPIQPPTAQAHQPASSTPPPQQPAQQSSPSVQPAHHIGAQQTPVGHPAHPAQPAQQTHQHPGSATQHTQPTHPTHGQQQHTPAHVPQQQTHLNGEQHAGMAGHLVQSPEDLHMQGYPSFIPPGYFHMPAFGFSDGNPDDALRMRYYEHPTSAGYAVASESTTSSSTAPQNSQSPPPQSPSQYPMGSYYYPPYGMHPYYQTSAPAQFQQFPGNYMYKQPNYNYNRMGSTGYPPNVHASNSPAGQTHTQYEDSDYSKYLQQNQQYSNFYPATGSAGTSASSSGQGVQQTGSSVSKPAQSFPASSANSAESGKSDYSKYNTHRSEPTSFYNNMGQQPGAFNQHQQHNFMQQHIPQNMAPSNQSSAYHHGQPLSNTSVQGQSGAQRSHYSGLP